MAIKVKDAAASAAKFVQRAGAAGADYKTGVENAGAAWANNTAAAQNTWVEAIQGAVANNRFQKGVTKAGPGKYTAAAGTKGAQRYPSGVASAGPAWQTGTQPFLTVISNLSLPPRRPKGDPGNIQRVSAVADALRAAKLAQ